MRLSDKSCWSNLTECKIRLHKPIILQRYEVFSKKNLPVASLSERHCKKSLRYDLVPVTACNTLSLIRLLNFNRTLIQSSEGKEIFFCFIFFFSKTDQATGRYKWVCIKILHINCRVDHVYCLGQVVYLVHSLSRKLLRICNWTQFYKLLDMYLQREIIIHTCVLDMVCMSWDSALIQGDCLYGKWHSIYLSLLTNTSCWKLVCIKAWGFISETTPLGKRMKNISNAR